MGADDRRRKAARRPNWCSATQRADVRRSASGRKPVAEFYTVDLAPRCRIDIAAFEVTQTELEKMRKAPFSLWPPEPPQADNCKVLLAGYPAAGIEAVGPRHASFGIYTASAIAQRATDWQITARIEWKYVVGSPAFGGLPPQNFDTGGMSGGPMLSIRERRGVLSFPLAGVIAEGRTSDDTIIAERADFIRGDGSVR